MLGSWKTMPIDFRTRVASLTMSKPLTFAVPEVGFRIVQSIEIVVVLPAPFGPSKAKTSPDSTAMSNWSTAVIELNVLVSLKVSITLVIDFSQLDSRVDAHDLYLFCDD
jgi:hypothetical protein